MRPVIRTLFLAMVAALLCLTLACGDDDPDSTPGAESGDVATAVPTAAGPSCSPARPWDGQSLPGVLSAGGVERSYRVHVPSGYDGSAAVPLVLLLHGFGSTGEFIASYAGTDALADAVGFVTVQPDALGTPTRWNVTREAAEADDLAFARDLLSEVETRLCIDPDRVYAAGYSSGGGMAQLLACEMPDRIAAIGVVAGVYAPCQANVPMIAFHGTADPVVPIDGGEIAAEQGGGLLNPVRRSVSEWGRALGCDPLQVISRPSANVELSTFGNCRRGGGKALLYAVIGGGHTWPGAQPLPEDVVGPTSAEIDATMTMWEFFDANPLAH
jgi:polyhydroxybutyrate depolymerase